MWKISAYLAIPFGSERDETVCSMVYRTKRYSLIKILDFIVYPFEKNHCEESFLRHIKKDNNNV